MYTATIFLFLAMPLVLGSLLSFVIFMVYPIIIVLRIKNEEMVLSRELVGYKEYLTKVKYRLIPYIW
jgi:protein-S-isoprenylcysteine O-methyltransferase Ste14